MNLDIKQMYEKYRDVNVTKECSLKLKLGEYMFCLLISVITAMQFKLRPFSNANPGTDSSVFLYIGKMMHEGYVPYRDLFDHKGLILYFIQYLGMFLSTDKYLGLGVWLIEVFNMFLFVMAVLKITKLLTNSKSAQYISACIIPIYCGKLVYEGGNLVEEYALPWITISLYIMMKYFIWETFKQYEIMILGISFGIVFFLRPNMISVWISFVPIIFFTMLYKKNWMDLRKCIILFVLGCCCILFPVLGYCVYTGSLYDMVSCYFTFNMSYTGSGQSAIGCLYVMVAFLADFSFSIPFILLSFANVNAANRKILALNCVYFAISLILASISGRNYAHYAMVLLPAIIVFITYAMMLIGRFFTALKSTKNHESAISDPLDIRFQKLVVVICVIISLLSLRNQSFVPSFDRTQSPIAQYIVKNTDRDEDVLIIGNLCDTYLVTGRSTKNKFFYQIPPVNVSNRLAEEFMEELLEHPSNTIIVNYNKTEILNQNSNIGNACRYLEEQYKKGIYSCVDFDSYYVYTLNE